MPGSDSKISWHNFHPYIFPSISLVGKIINKINEDSVEKAILVFPFWKAQSWLPLVLSNIFSLPVRLPRHKDLLQMAHSGGSHPLSQQMRLIVVTISGRSYIIEEFQNQLRSSFSTQGVQGPGSSTSQPGRCGWLGMVSGLWIPFTRLRL